MYTGPPALTLSRAVTSWTLDLPVLVAVLLAAGLYLAGMRRLRRAGQPWPVARAVSFLAGGTGALVIATMSFLGVYQGVLFSVRAVQNVLLLLVAPLFLALRQAADAADRRPPATRGARGGGGAQRCRPRAHLPRHHSAGTRDHAVPAVFHPVVRGRAA